MSNIYNFSEEDLQVYYLSLLRSFIVTTTSTFPVHETQVFNGRNLPKSMAL